jgi:hypothetical protein
MASSTCVCEGALIRLSREPWSWSDTKGGTFPLFFEGGITKALTNPGSGGRAFETREGGASGRGGVRLSEDVMLWLRGVLGTSRRCVWGDPTGWEGTGFLVGARRDASISCCLNTS